MLNRNKVNPLLIIAVSLNLINVSCSQDQLKAEENPANKTLVFMEEGLQRTNSVQLNMGNACRMEVRSEMMSVPRNERDGVRYKRLEYVFTKMETIDTRTVELIRYIDQLKTDLVMAAGEKNEEIIVKKGKDLELAQLDLNALKNPSAQVGITDSEKLHRSMSDYRDSLVFLCSNYEWSDQSYRLPVISGMDNHSNDEAFLEALNAQLDVTTYNYMEDRYVLLNLYAGLSRNVWKTIDQRNSSLLTNLCLLSVLQQDVLASRTLALMHWKSKVSTGEYSFDSISAIIQGPEIVETGKSLEYKVFCAATDSERQSELTVSSPKGVAVEKNSDGSYSLVVPAEQSGVINLSGTLTITNKSGIKRVEPWEKRVVVR